MQATLIKYDEVQTSKQSRDGNMEGPEGKKRFLWEEEGMGKREEKDEGEEGIYKKYIIMNSIMRQSQI